MARLWLLLLAPALRFGLAGCSWRRAVEPNAWVPIHRLSTHQTGDWAAYCPGRLPQQPTLRRLSGWAPSDTPPPAAGTVVASSTPVCTLACMRRWIWVSTSLASVGRHRQTPVHHRRIFRLAAAAAAGNHVHHGMMRRLGRRWGQLHRAVYLIGVLVLLHYAWLVGADLTYLAIIGRRGLCEIW